MSATAAQLGPCVWLAAGLALDSCRAVSLVIGDKPMEKYDKTPPVVCGWLQG